MEEDDNQFKITCQWCNGFVKCSGRSVELLSVTFIHAGFFTLGIYTENLDPDIFYFHCPDRTKMQRLYQKLFKE